ncbi:MAG: serine hydrolase [Candidatus Paceibacteria bacterium]
MRLFVYALGVVFGVVFLSLNHVTTTSAVSEDVASALPVCSFGKVEVVESLSAGAWQIVDMDTKLVLAEYESKDVFPFASIVKLITSYAVQQQSNLSDGLITLTYEDILTEGRSGNLQIGENYSPQELLFPLLVTSSNDAGAALARVYPDIISTMQAFTIEAGVTNTNIADTTGLSRQNLTTANDLSLIIQSLYHQSPHTFDITRTPQIISQYNNGWVNNIPFRTLSGYQGGKQGYLPEAKQTGVAVFTVGEIVPKTFSIAILYSDSVARDMRALHQAVVENYSCNQIVGAV